MGCISSSNTLISSLFACHFSSPYSVQIDLGREQLHQFFYLAQSMFGAPYSEHNLYVECYFHHLDGIMFQGDIHNRYALYRAQNTISFSWSKSCLETIYNTVEMHVVRKYMNFISCRKTCFQTRFCTNWM